MQLVQADSPWLYVFPSVSAASSLPALWGLGLRACAALCAQQNLLAPADMLHEHAGCRQRPACCARRLRCSSAACPHVAGDAGLAQLAVAALQRVNNYHRKRRVGARLGLRRAATVSPGPRASLPRTPSQLPACPAYGSSTHTHLIPGAAWPFCRRVRQAAGRRAVRPVPAVLLPAVHLQRHGGGAAGRRRPHRELPAVCTAVRAAAVCFWACSCWTLRTPCFG